MLIRRCAVLYLEPREELDLDLSALFSGQGVLGAATRWIALAPHLGTETELSPQEAAAIGAIGQTLWLERAACEQRHGADTVARLLELGLLIADGAEHAAMRERDETLRSQHWRPLSALAHVYSRWTGMRADKGMQFPSFDQLVDSYGAPPPPTIELSSLEDAIALPQPAPQSQEEPRAGARPAPQTAPQADPRAETQVEPQPGTQAECTPLEQLLLARYTGRNFDPQATLPLAVAARLLQRAFGAQFQREMAPGAMVLKKASPSAGGLHPTEAYVIAQRIAGVAPGLYHYHPLRHVLEPLRAMDTAQTAELALGAVADQEWFVDAPMLVVLAARVERNFWKYRNHAKAHRAVLLDCGHLSQTFYLLAQEAGMPAFVTAAINEGELEQAFGLDPLRHMVVAVCGCGPASGRDDMLELRP
ncbi:putative peptide maturation dehydrogenase [Oxalobacteraceae bacterium A2-2]